MKAMDVAPLIMADRTMVPLRFVAEALGAEVGWDAPSNTATVKLDGKTLQVTIGVLSSGMDVPAIILSDRTFVPLRFVSESLGCQVVWNGADQSIVISR